MTIVILQIAAALIGIVSLLMQQPKDKYNDAQNNRQDVINGNTAAVESHIDRLLVGTNSGVTGEPSAEDVQRRLSQL